MASLTLSAKFLSQVRSGCLSLFNSPLILIIMEREGVGAVYSSYPGFVGAHGIEAAGT